MKTVVISIITLIFSLSAMAQDRKVAVFDPAGNVSGAIREIVREEISSIIVNAGGYAVLERQLINKVLEENRFQSGGLVDDSQISEMGKRMGANIVFVTSITALGNDNYYISCKMIDVQTARIEKQKTAQSSMKETDLLSVVQKTVREMLGDPSIIDEIRSQTGKLISDERSIFAQDGKVAIFDPAGTVDNSIREVVREEISSIIVNADGYTVLERQLINKVLEENRFQSGGLVDDSQMSEMGKRMGANFVFVTNMTAMSNNNHYVSFKLIDVETARIEKQRTATTRRGSTELIEVVQKVVGEMFEYTAQQTEKPALQPKQTVKPAVVEKPLSAFGILVANDGMVSKDGKELTNTEVRMLMAHTDALRVYNKGLSKNRSGNFWMITGGGMFAAGVVVAATKPFEWRYEYSEYGYDYYRYRDDEFNLWLGVGIATAGIIATVSGIILKMNGKKLIHSSVDMYNSGKSRSNVEFGFNFTGNGVRLVIHF